MTISIHTYKFATLHGQDERNFAKIITGEFYPQGKLTFSLQIGLNRNLNFNVYLQC